MNVNENRVAVSDLFFLAEAWRHGEPELWQGQVEGMILQGKGVYDTSFLVRCQAWEGDGAKADRLTVVSHSDMFQWNFYGQEADMLADRDRVLAAWRQWVAKRKEEDAKMRAGNPFSGDPTPCS